MMGPMAEGVMGAMAGRKIQIESLVRRGCLGSSHGLFFCEIVCDVHTRCEIFVKWYMMYIRCEIFGVTFVIELRKF